MQPKESIVDIAEPPHEVVQEHGAEEEVEDAVPDHLAGGRDDVASFRAAPGDRVEHCHERDETSSADVARPDTSTCVESRARTMTEENSPTRFG